ncbi:MAG: carboxymuconolactone decarboxylase family protein [Promethearchaeota archaeon]
MDDDMKEYFMTAGALSKKVKEIIGVAISVYIQCQFYTAWHVKRAMDASATREEILEACQVSAMVGGGHSDVHTLCTQCN